MTRLHFPGPFAHEHPPVRNINWIIDERATRGQRTADWVASFVGSWKFMLGQPTLLILWVILNIAAIVEHWDPSIRSFS